MSLQAMTLTATETNWRLFMLRKADPAFLNFEKKIFIRDRYTCQFCGFQAQQFQEVVNLDHNYLNNRLSNLATACIFCTQCFFLESIGRSDFGGGTLVYLPEMTQGELNALCHVLFASMVTGNSYSGQAKNIYRSIRLRSQQIEKELGEGFSNPALFGHVLVDAHTEVAKKKELHAMLLQRVRVLPNMTRFVNQIEAWTQSSLNALSFD